MMPRRPTARGGVFVLALALMACGSDDAMPDGPPRDGPSFAPTAYCADPEPGAPSAEITAALMQVPGVAHVLEGTASDGDRFFTLTLRQLVDHSNPDGPTFE